jgi:hypothetical protein
MSETWGKGTLNNTIGWGQGACDNTINWGKSQKDSSVAASWSGDTDISGCSGAAGLAQIDNLNSMSFDGADENINVGNVSSLQGASVFTISSWIKVDSTGANRIFGSWIATTTKRIIGFAVYSNNTLVLQISNNGSSFQQKFSTSTIPLDTWKHVAVTFSSGAISFYIDGVKETPSASTITQLYNISSDYFIGALQPVPSSNYMSGLIDEVSIFNTALTEAEILSIYNATAVVGGVNKTADLSQLTTPPIAWYRM